MTWHSKRGEGQALRSGLILLEAAAAVAVMTIVMVMLVQATVWSLAERSRTAERQAMLEAAVNVMESARAQSWEQLATWAAKQELPKELEGRVRGAKLAVRVETEKAVLLARRVVVEIQWDAEPGLPPRSIELTAVFSPRSTLAAGGKR